MERGSLSDMSDFVGNSPSQTSIVQAQLKKASRDTSMHARTALKAVQRKTPACEVLGAPDDVV